MFPNQPKLVSLWFPPKQVGLATGLYMTGLGLGIALGMGTGASFTTWQSAVLILGILLAMVTALWIILARNRPAGVEAAKAVGLREGLVHVKKSKDMWFIIAVQIIVGVMILSYLGALPVVLPDLKGMSVGQAGLIPAIGIVGFIIGTFFWPVLSEKVGVRKPFFMGTTALAGIRAFFVYVLAPGPGMRALAFFPGFLAAPGLTFMLMAPIELPEIGPRYAGTAAGPLLSAFNTGAFIGLPFVFTPILVHIGGTTAFASILIFYMIAAALGLGMKEIGRKARGKAAA